MNKERLLFASFNALLIMFLILTTCSAKKIHHCNPLPSCGKFHNISYPFGLKGDPRNCGDPNYQLSCENNETLSLVFLSETYQVQAINREDFTIRVVDAAFHKKNDCSSLPNNSPPLDWPFYEHGLYWLQSLNNYVFLNCKNPAVNSTLYVNTWPCINASSSTENNFSYVISGDAQISDLMESCTIIKTVPSSLQMNCDKNCSYMDVFEALMYGFDLSWWGIYCQECKEWAYCIYNDYNYTEMVRCAAPHSTGINRILKNVSFGILRVIFAILHKVFGRHWRGMVENLPYEGGYHYYNLESRVLYAIGFGAASMIVLKFICGAPFVAGFLIYKWRRRHLSMYHTIEDYLQSHNNLMPIKYSFSNIKKMTKGFKDKLGEGGYGSVYKGKLRSGSEVAVKILGKSKGNGQEFISEVATIGRIHHFNVVRLIGFCIERSKRALVYEFMPNGSLEKYIFSQEEKASLSCEQMYKIALGIARGIEYLHKGCDIQILHFDIKPHNILLDENFNPKVSDFGLAKLYPTENSIVSLTAARGTMGYMAPELFYKNIGGISYKADVYSFGMLLMEMASRRKNLKTNVEKLSQIYFPSWVHHQFNEGKDIEMRDATKEEKEISKKMIIVALWCIQLKPNDRPSMNKVIEMLEQEIENLKMPPKPFVCPQEESEEEVEINTKETESRSPPIVSSDSASLLHNSS